ncbi:MAG: hypothetical protein KKF46_01065 [Nanoarchaeota archaeon]|nr:hypothetical protein [Nanoarchaeota archaeon]MBU1320923.1 hypothetical protein [Nanoarchaeota archaeon]MBU1597552.1 hypothetical protein [Nanoarchaeota archaeon]MBU2441945.1 hypothetical protein [Nanoarchaeota archaeon]
MKHLIGSKYQETKNNLREKIRQGKISPMDVPLAEQFKDHACYFCLDKIIGKVQVLEEETKTSGVEQKIEYSICIPCSEKAKHYIFCDEVPFASIN